MSTRKTAVFLLGCCVLLAGLSVGCEKPAKLEGPPIAIRPEHLLVLPGTGPVTHVLVQNRTRSLWRGKVIARFPQTWKMDKTEQSVTVGPLQTARVPFSIARGVDSADNVYPVRVEAVAEGQDPGKKPQVFSRDQIIVAATAPYYKPTIDGKLDDWNDAVPVMFVTGGKKTTVSTYWNRKEFLLLVAVEEDRWIPRPKRAAAAGFDAVQIAVSPPKAKTPAKPREKAQRYEFLLTSTDAGGACFALIRPGEKLAVALQRRDLDALKLDAAEVKVFSKAGVTYYECAIPLAAMPTIRANAGREFRFSVLVHDPDGTGLRDWGRAAGLWPWQRSRLAWCDWVGATWPKLPPFDNKIEWGFCSSRR